MHEKHLISNDEMVRRVLLLVYVANCGRDQFCNVGRNVVVSLAKRDVDVNIAVLKHEVLEVTRLSLGEMERSTTSLRHGGFAFCISVFLSARSRSMAQYQVR